MLLANTPKQPTTSGPQEDITTAPIASPNPAGGDDRTAAERIKEQKKKQKGEINTDDEDEDKKNPMKEPTNLRSTAENFGKMDSNKKTPGGATASGGKDKEKEKREKEEKFAKEKQRLEERRQEKEREKFDDKVKKSVTEMSKPVEPLPVESQSPIGNSGKPQSEGGRKLNFKPLNAGGALKTSSTTAATGGAGGLKDGNKYVDDTPDIIAQATSPKLVESNLVTSTPPQPNDPAFSHQKPLPKAKVAGLLQPQVKFSPLSSSSTTGKHLDLKKPAEAKKKKDSDDEDFDAPVAKPKVPLKAQPAQGKPADDDWDV